VFLLLPSVGERRPQDIVPGIRRNAADRNLL